MSFIQNRSRALRELKNKLFNSRFFTISVLFHLVLVLGLGGTVIIQKATEPPDFTGGDPDSKFVQNEVAPTAPPPPPQETPTLTPTVQNEKALEAITTTAPTMTTFQLPAVTPVVPVTTVDPTKIAAPTVKVNPQQLTSAQAQRIRDFTGKWAKQGKGSSGFGSSPKERDFEFDAYLAKYAGGDWASTNNIRDGQIFKGSLPNLLYFMGNLSKGHIKANPVHEPLDLSKWEDISAKKPPFIFFTGHRDFVLTEQEVETLQKYIQSGGCIWGDSSLPGLRSRFDLAFRREMRRVIPDADKDWEVLPPTYPMFTKNLYYPEVPQPPTGVNYYKEPVYALRFGGEVAIIYTPNDYGDMWRLALHQKGGDATKHGEAVLEIDTTRVEHSWEMKYTDDSFYQKMGGYYRGLELPRLINSYKFGTNVVIHLLTRWEDRLKTIPKGM